MPTIKITAEGKVITKSGLPSCTCCAGCGTDCNGPWGPGYDSLPETVEVRVVDPFEGPPTTWIRTGKCTWDSLDNTGQLAFCLSWAMNVASFGIPDGSKPGNFDDGPTGYYYFFNGGELVAVVLVE